jgi:hypothetical protein
MYKLGRAVRMYACRGPAKEVLYGGTVEIMGLFGKERTPRKIRIHNVLYIPDLRHHIISMVEMRKHNAMFTLRANGDAFVTHEETGEIMLEGESEEGEVPFLKWERNVEKFVAAGAAQSADGDLNLWHQRLGHVGKVTLQKMAKGAVRGMEVSKGELHEECLGCSKGKMKAAVHPRKGPEFRARRKLELVHVDLMGDIQPESYGGKRYLMVLTDDYSRYSWVYGLKKKSEALEVFKVWVAQVEKETEWGIEEVWVKTLRSDRGGEFYALRQFCEEKGIKQQFTAGYSPQSNGVAERMNGILQQMGRCMLHHSGLDIRFWGEAILAACHVRNRCPSSVLPDNVTPFELWHGRKPNVAHLRVWGCKVHVLVPQQKRDDGKFGAKCLVGVFVGYSRNSKTYRVWNIGGGKIEEYRDVRFFESLRIQDDVWDGDQEWIVLPEQPESSEEGAKRNQRQADADEEPEVEVPAMEEAEERGVKKSGRQNKGVPPKRLTYEEKGKQVEGYVARTEGILEFCGDFEKDVIWGCIAEVDEPRNVREALGSGEKKKWEAAMKSELDSLKENKVWDLVDLPEGKRAIGSKWLFKRKKGVDGEVKKYKARLVILGNREVKGIDYDEVYAPVIRFDSLRALIGISVAKDWDIQQMDVKTAFLYGNLEEEVYMTQPEGAVVKGEEHKVCRLRKSLYGLKQAPRCWNKKITDVLMSEGFCEVQK